MVDICKFQEYLDNSRKSISQSKEFEKKYFDIPLLENGKKQGHNKISYNYLRSPTQVDHNSRRSQYWHMFFILFSCFSCGKFEKTLVYYL